MKKPTFIETIEIGSLVGELATRGAQVSLMPYPAASAVPKVRVISNAQGLNPTRPRDYVTGTLTDRLRQAANAERQRLKLPTLQEEAAAACAADDKHAESPLVEIGPDASCSCGSNVGLRVSRTGLVSWKTGKAYFDPCGVAQRGEIGTCAACNRSYTFGA